MNNFFSGLNIMTGWHTSTKSFVESLGELTFNAILDILMIPLYLVFGAIDLFLDKVPGLALVPSYIRQLTSIVGEIPEAFVALTGVNPYIWNALFLVYVGYMVMSPAINTIKTVWAWVRP